MQTSYGDLEKYLGAKYARDLEENPELLEVYEEAQDVLYGSMNVMSMVNRVGLLMKGKPNRGQQAAS